MMSTMNGVPYYSSHPLISIDGDLKNGLGDTLLTSLLVEESKAGLYRCEARFNNWAPRDARPFPLFAPELVDFGKKFEVTMGPPDIAKRVFNGRIIGIEAHYPQQQPPEVTILAEDRFQDLRMERRTRTFEDSSDEDVVQAIATQHGLRAAVDVDGPTYPVLTQLNQSDLAFLRERAASVDAEVWIDDQTVHFQSRNQRDAGDVTLIYKGNLYEFSILADLAHQRSSVRVNGWDIASKQAIDEEANESTISGELNGYQGGSTLLAQKLAERHERLVTAVPLSSAEALSMAQTRYRNRARRFLTGTGTADGNPDIRVGCKVEISSIGPLFNGRYDVTLVRHTFDRFDGYRTFFEVERAGIGG
ncbi:MAG: hypothetical protein DWQ04_17150 [Chloroflexi bacterium]|nr:MAG: hypothetical protein DWQ04_17150 [Chloroflexota bacterium]